MRHLVKFAFLAGAALAVSACSRPPAAENEAASEVGQNESLEVPGNDASATEAVANTPLPPPPPPAESSAAETPAPDMSGGDPDGGTPNVESNVSGM